MSRSFALVLPFALLAAPALAAQGVTATAHVVITGGTNPGAYDISVDKLGCSTGTVGPGSFGTQISNSKLPPTALASVQIGLPKPTVEGQFQMVIGFGSILKRTAEYEVNTLPDAKKTSGKGTVKVTGLTSNTPSATFDVTTEKGVHIVGSVSCKSVIRV